MISLKEFNELWYKAEKDFEKDFEKEKDKLNNIKESVETVTEKKAKFLSQEEIDDLLDISDDKNEFIKIFNTEFEHTLKRMGDIKTISSVNKDSFDISNKKELNNINSKLFDKKYITISNTINLINKKDLSEILHYDIIFSIEVMKANKILNYMMGEPHINMFSYDEIEDGIIELVDNILNTTKTSFNAQDYDYIINLEINNKRQLCKNTNYIKYVYSVIDSKKYKEDQIDFLDIEILEDNNIIDIDIYIDSSLLYLELEKSRIDDIINKKYNELPIERNYAIYDFRKPPNLISTESFIKFQKKLSDKLCDLNIYYSIINPNIKNIKIYSLEQMTFEEYIYSTEQYGITSEYISNNDLKCIINYNKSLNNLLLNMDEDITNFSSENINSINIINEKIVQDINTIFNSNLKISNNIIDNNYLSTFNYSDIVLVTFIEIVYTIESKETYGFLNLVLDAKCVNEHFKTKINKIYKYSIDNIQIKSYQEKFKINELNTTYIVDSNKFVNKESKPLILGDDNVFLKICIGDKIIDNLDNINVIEFNDFNNPMKIVTKDNVELYEGKIVVVEGNFGLKIDNIINSINDVEIIYDIVEYNHKYYICINNMVIREILKDGSLIKPQLLL